eukprot:m.306574 g.306574  ORF g.306574 m.306574 type:complete len:82 (+) comp41362_c0_seq1:96-341(+)
MSAEKVVVKTPGFDARFPNTNQTKNCWQNYVDFHRCVKAKENQGESSEVCEWFATRYKSFCPKAWVDDWDSKKEEGTFPGL